MEIIREDYIHFRRWRNFDVVRTGRQAEIIKEHTALMNADVYKRQMYRSKLYAVADHRCIQQICCR